MHCRLPTGIRLINRICCCCCVRRRRQVELNNVRSFYKESQKSPFKFFPWKTGNMHFKFLPVGAPSLSV